MRHIISISDFTKKEIDEIVKGASRMIKHAKEKIVPPQAKTKKKPKVSLLFLEPSTRTLGSFEEAARILGWPTKIISGKEGTSLMKKESLANTVRMMAIQGTDILILRTKEEGTARFAAEILEKSGFEKISVINAGDGANQHPTQTFLDRLTILKELGRLKDFIFGFVGDLKYSRTVHSLLSSFSLEDNVKFKFVSCPETKLPQKYKRNLDYVESDSLEDLKDCDIIYVTRIQEERFTDPLELERVRGKFKITKEVLEGFKKSVKIMHPLPYVDEISPEIRLDKRVIIDKQAWYGIPTRIYLLLWANKKRFEKGEKESLPKIEKEILVDMEIEKYLAKRKKEEKYFRPIRNGVVLDHLPVGTGDKIKKCLIFAKVLKENSVIHLIENVPSRKMKIKDVLILENAFLTEDLYGLIRVIAPQVTFNVLKDGRFKKIKVKLPEKILSFNSLLSCPNKLCITNLDPEAKPKFQIIKAENEKFILKCEYCEREFEREEIIKTI